MRAGEQCHRHFRQFSRKSVYLAGWSVPERIKAAYNGRCAAPAGRFVGLSRRLCREIWSSQIQRHTAISGYVLAERDGLDSLVWTNIIYQSVLAVHCRLS